MSKIACASSDERRGLAPFGNDHTAVPPEILATRLRYEMPTAFTKLKTRFRVPSVDCVWLRTTRGPTMEKKLQLFSLAVNEANKYQTNTKQITNKQTTKTHQQIIATVVPSSEHNVLSQSAFGNWRGQVATRQQRWGASWVLQSHASRPIGSPQLMRISRMLNIPMTRAAKHPHWSFRSRTWQHNKSTA
jgi:hypothetical protein